MIFISNLAIDNSDDIKKEIPIKKQASFFIPLGMTFVLIGTTHSLFNAILARLPSQEILISAFAVAKSLMQVIQNPVAMVRQTVTALVKDRLSYYQVRKFSMIMVSIVIFIFSIIAFTDLSRLIFKNIMGLKGEVLQKAITIFKVLVLFPMAVTLRNFMQGIAIKFRLTPLVTLATIVRVIFVGSILLFIDKLSFIPGDILSGAMFLGAITIEGIIMFIGVKIPIRDIPRELEKIKYKKNIEVNKLSYRFIFSFFWPLIITSTIKAMAKPIINGGLARTQSPEIAISAYAVAWGLGVIVLSPLFMFHQVSLNFIDEFNPLSKKSVKKFAIYVSVTLSFIIGVIAFTSVGNFILIDLMGITKNIQVMSKDVLKIMTLLPLVVVIRQFYWGILMKNHKTIYISQGKIVNLIALSITVFLVTFINPSNPAIIGIIGMLTAEIFESIFLYFVSEKKKLI
ncbi:MAG: hypothetical protein FH753_15145 [Firmicutes bacterium]|nr:hypothetical protein [Bacillota bacterium]